MSDTLSKAILKGHKPKYPVNDYKRTKKYNNLEELPAKESITYGRDSYDMHNTEYRYALIRRFLLGMVGKHIDEVYSKYKQIIKDVSDNKYLNNPIRFDQWEKVYRFHGFIINENGILEEDKDSWKIRKRKAKQEANPYYVYAGNIKSKRFFSDDYIFVQFKDKEYIHNGLSWHEYVKEEVPIDKYWRCDKVFKEYIQDQYPYKYFIHKLRALSNKEIITLNLNPLLDMPFKLFKLPDNYK